MCSFALKMCSFIINSLIRRLSFLYFGSEIQFESSMKVQIYLTSILIFSGFWGGLIAQSDSLQYYYGKSVAAHKAGNFRAFLESTAAANRLRPYHPTLTYNLAAAFSLNERTGEAIHYLRRFILMNSTVDFSKDEDFSSLKASEDFPHLLQLQSRLTDSVSRSYPAFQLEGDEFHAECMAYDPERQTFYFGGVHQAGVRLFDSKTKKSRSWIGIQELDHLYSVLGMAVDGRKKSLWIVSAALPQFEGYEKKLKGHSSVYEIDLQTKNILTHIHLEGSSRLSELTFYGGTAYVADGLNNRIYRLKSGDTQLHLLADLQGQARNLQGMAVTPDGRSMFVSDYVSGIFKVELTDGSFERLRLADHIPFKGIDGLFFYDHSLIATQNGSSPMRVMRLFLNSRQDQAVEWSIIDQNLSYLNEPTQGVLLNDTFYYIANSPWPAYDDNGKLRSDRLAPVQIRKFRLSHE